MPDERMRALRWGGEVLKALEADLFHEPQWVEHAVRLLRDYPSPEGLADLVEVPGAPLPAGCQTAIDQARELFVVALSETGSSALRRDLQYTLRHFPSAGVAMALASAAVHGTLGDWLSCESEC
jgi:hypothetical protein